jgi:hypothetical protein
MHPGYTEKIASMIREAVPSLSLEAKSVDLEPMIIDDQSLDSREESVMKLTMVCPTPIRQFTVREAGLYAWRNLDTPKSELDKAWFFGELQPGDKIEGQYEGTGPITWKTIDQ